MTDFDLNALVDRALASKEPDPHVIARRLVARVPEDELRAVVASLLVERVTLRMRMQRNLPVGQRPSDAQSSPAAGTAGRSRWERHARYCVAGEWKFYPDLSADDCDVIADGYAERAAANAVLEGKFRDLAKQVRTARVERVADLDSDLGVAA